MASTASPALPGDTTDGLQTLVQWGIAHVVTIHLPTCTTRNQRVLRRDFFLDFNKLTVYIYTVNIRR